MNTTYTTHVLIFGAGRTNPAMLDYARRAVQRAHTQGCTVLAADRPTSIDRAVVRACGALRVPLIIAGITPFPRCGSSHHAHYVRVHPDTYPGLHHRNLPPFTVRDRWLCDHAQIGLFLWNCVCPITKAAFDYMHARHANAHLIRF